MRLRKEPQLVEKLPIAPGDSSEQRAAETVMVAELSRLRGISLSPLGIALDGGGYVEVDGVAPDHSLMCEAYAHQGPLKRAQTNKVLADALKLVYLARSWPDAERVLLFSDNAAARTLRAPSRAWYAKALAAFGVNIEVVELPADMRESLLQAQLRQKR